MRSRAFAILTTILLAVAILCGVGWDAISLRLLYGEVARTSEYLEPFGADGLLHLVVSESTLNVEERALWGLPRSDFEQGRYYTAVHYAKKWNWLPVCAFRSRFEPATELEFVAANIADLVRRIRRFQVDQGRNPVNWIEFVGRSEAVVQHVWLMKQFRWTLNSSDTGNSFELLATPMQSEIGLTFYADESGVVRCSSSDIAGPNSAEYLACLDRFGD